MEVWGLEFKKTLEKLQKKKSKKSNLSSSCRLQRNLNVNVSIHKTIKKNTDYLLSSWLILVMGNNGYLESNVSASGRDEKFK